MNEKITVKYLVGNLIFFGIVLLILARFLSVWSGTAFPISIISAGSMQPTLFKGDVIAWNPTTIDQVNEGDVIVFKSWVSWPEEEFIVHRVDSIETRYGEPALVTKGDANNYTDQAGPHVIEPYVTDNNLVGKVISLGQYPLRVPFIGMLGIGANDLFESLTVSSAQKATNDYIGVFAPLMIALIVFVVALFVLPERTKNIRERLKQLIFGPSRINVRETVVLFFVMYLVLLSAIHISAYDEEDASVGVNEFPPTSSYELGSITQQQPTTLEKPFPVFNPTIFPMKGVVIGGGRLDIFIDKQVFQLKPTESKTIQVTATLPNNTLIQNGSFKGKIKVYSSPLWFIIPDEIFTFLLQLHPSVLIIAYDAFASTLLTLITVLLIVFADRLTKKIIELMIYADWRCRPTKIITEIHSKISLLTSFNKPHLLKHIRWLFSIEPLKNVETKIILISTIAFPIYFLTNNLLAMVISSIIAGILGYIANLKERKQIITVTILPIFIISIFSILSSAITIYETSPEMMEFITLLIGMIALYLIIIASFIIPICLFSWIIANWLRNIKERKNPMVSLEGRCDL